MNFLSFLIFIPLQLLFLPLGLIGVFLVAYKQLIVSKRLGSSQTAIEVINGRWTMHVFDIRNDDATEKLAKVLPNTSTFGLWLVLFPLWLKYKICGRYFGYPRLPKEGEENIADLVTARTVYFDRIIDRLANDAEQFVVLGAGYDTRAYGALKERGLSFFELDQVETQRNKIEQLSKAGIDHSHVTFISVDFKQDRIFDKLEANGFDRSKCTIFLWEGVTLYLSENDIRKILGEIRENIISGSAVVTDFYADRLIQIGKTKAGKKTLELTNEGFAFGLPFSTDPKLVFSRFITSQKLGVGETYFMGEADKNGPFAVVSEIKL